MQAHFMTSSTKGDTSWCGDQDTESWVNSKDGEALTGVLQITFQKYQRIIKNLRFNFLCLPLSWLFLTWEVLT